MEELQFRNVKSAGKKIRPLERNVEPIQGEERLWARSLDGWQRGFARCFGTREVDDQILEGDLTNDQSEIDVSDRRVQILAGGDPRNRPFDRIGQGDSNEKKD